MENELRRVLQKMVVSNHPELHNVEVKKIGSNYDFYNISFSGEPKISRDCALTVINETTTLFKMFSLNDGSDFQVKFMCNVEADG